ncbi:hypothetical protein [Ewingella americana]|nr:hypothetical protein [Ewingella americana]
MNQFVEPLVCKLRKASDKRHIDKLIILKGWCVGVLVFVVVY